MSDLRKAAQMALEALDGVLDTYGEPLDLMTISGGTYEALECRDAITALRAALAMPEQTRSQQMRDAGYTRRPRQLPEEEDEQEPVGWFESPHGAFRANLLYKLEFPSQLLSWSVPLYTAPPQRKPLTDVNIKGIVDLGLQTWKLSESTVEFARAIEAAHGIGGEE